ncbi:MAG: OmpA family protein [Deltaproteobacteria bacterium]|nr:OmpA family protein [Deltaproteobacteria bacterium]
MISRHLCAISVVFALTSNVYGQIPVDTSFPVQLFEPAIGTRDLLMAVEPASVADHLDFALSLTLNYAHKPLVLFVQDTQGTGTGTIDLSKAQQLVLVRHQLSADVGGAIGFAHRWFHAQLGLSLPVNLVLRGTRIDDQLNEAGSLSATGVGDLRIQLKVSLLRNYKGLSVAFSPIITVPTGDQDAFGGEPNLSVKPRVVADFRLRDFVFAANLGWLFRESSTLVSSEVGHRLLYGLGAGYEAHRRVRVFGEIYGQMGFGTKSNCETASNGRVVCSDSSSTDLDAFPLEALAGARVSLPFGLMASGGVGFGLIQALGSPQVRVIAGLRWAPDFTDTDGDGIYDQDDRCPTQPEDFDGFQDKDGCPDPDNDGDLIPDVRDKCPNEPEDRDTFEDDDGCPDPDNDKDGIPDIRDSCPFKPETKNGYKDDDGCPDVPDQDDDGVPDTTDKCPNEKEDRDGFQDDDGCADPDNDNDGVPDSFDACPNDAEDIDGFEDDDGCPDPDNDRDGVPDAQDKCPNKPETINGYRDDDGCPDRGKVNVQIQADKIVITKKIYFATALARIKTRSFSIVDQVALVLRANPQVKGVRIEGHTDGRGDAKRNLRLSQKRAEAVRDRLIAQGVEPTRLIAVGFGSRKPIASNKTRRGRAANRRVEFIILERADDKKTPKAKGAIKPADDEDDAKDDAKDDDN